MIITKKKEPQEAIKHLGDEKKVFVVECGERSTASETGGKKDALQIKELLEEEVDKDRDCVWTLIYSNLKEKKPHLLKEIRAPKDYSKTSKPRKLTPPSKAPKQG
jgi:hypothetical protein